MNGYDAFTFAIMVIVLPLFLVVLGAALILAAPVLIPAWLLERRKRGQRPQG